MTPSNDGQVLSRESVKRDPRIDPRPGDVLERVWHLETDTVEVLPGGFYRSKLGDSWTPARPIYLTGWRKWASKATVITRGA